ncbi:hypothetical protein D0T90_01970 [Neisseria animalis]|uniref:Uncharacterized protein n=1 Tax=Neisseria animalis TaxID=492 RepID=A0A5P3MS05_NEIAN|nr:hypothetical protein D0T90_01970 [Neisseria animalis]ROW33266.1 hypothetical protein CGZ60_00715 [Neisseria animalis]
MPSANTAKHHTNETALPKICRLHGSADLSRPFVRLTPLRNITNLSAACFPHFADGIISKIRQWKAVKTIYFLLT